MGVDAVIEIRGPSPSNLRRLSANLCAAIGVEKFWLEPEQDRHALEQRDGSTIVCHTLWRYYGPDYSRGPWPTIRATLSWLRQNFPQSSIYYGGDSSDDLALVDDTLLADFDFHFNSSGHDTYQAVFGSRDPKPSCVFCGDRPMSNHGGGGGQVFLSCHGCGADWILASDGSMHKLQEKEDFFAASTRLRGGK